MYTLGADPEMFVRSAARKVRIPICGLVGGTKTKPIRFPGLPATFMYQEDNVAFEVNVPPSSDSRTFATNVQHVLDAGTKLLAPKGLTVDLTLSAHRFSDEELSHPLAQTIGCTPDKCAYSPEGDDPVVREPFEIKDLGNWRFTGGHIHFGYDKTLLPEHVMVRLIDAFVYLPFLPKDTQRARRSKYGLAGLYRSKPYGLEYRTPSNFWLQDYGRTISMNGFTLLADVHHRLSEVNDAYHSLPIEEIKACIDSGGRGWDELSPRVESIAEGSGLGAAANFGRELKKAVGV